MVEAERLFIEDDNSPIQTDIILEPKYLTYGHVRLMENVKIYEYLVAYLFHEIQSSNPRMNNIDDIVYDLLNKRKFENLDITSSEIDLGNPNRPYYSHDDYREYINRFLEVIESQNLVSLINDLGNRNILDSKSVIFNEKTKSNMDDIKYRVRDLDNKSKTNKVMNYNLEPEGATKSRLDAFISGKPIMSSSLDNYVTVSPDSIKFDAEKYIEKMLKDANIMDRNGNLKSGKKKSLKRTVKRKVGTIFDAKDVQIRGKLETKDVTGKSGILYALRVEVNEDGDREYVFYGLGEDKVFTDFNEAKTYFDSVKPMGKDDLDLNKPISNPIKDSIMSFVQPENGKLKTGHLNITFKKMKLTKTDIAALTGDYSNEEVDNVKDILEASRDRKKVLEAEKTIRDKANASVSIDEQNKLIIESDEGDEDVVDIDSEKEILEEIIETYGASFVDAAINKEPQEFLEWYKKPKQKRIVQDKTVRLGTKEVEDVGRLKMTPNIFPVFKITNITREYMSEYNFKINKTFLSSERSASSKEGEYQMSDIGRINRLKATYRNLERMVDRF